MNIRHFKEYEVKLGQRVFIDETAVVIGEVAIGDDSSVWPTAVIRADVNHITIGARTSIQDGSVLHVSHANENNPGGDPLSIGDDVTVGHRVVLHGCEIHEQCLIGINSVVMDKVVIEAQVMVGANSLVPPGKRLESGYLYLGSPVKKIRPLTEDELVFLKYSAEHYVRLKDEYLKL